MKMKKLISATLFALLIVISSAICAFAANNEIDVYLEEYSGIDGQRINFDTPPQSINNRTMVPIRAIFEAMGATVVWDDVNQTAISTKKNTVVKMKLNSTTEYINGSPVEMDVTPVMINGRILAPARYVAEAFGYNVKWDEMTDSVLISKNSNYDISKVVDGTREHPYKLGDTVTFDFWDDNKKGNCNLTIYAFLTPEKCEDEFGEDNIFTINDFSCITGHIKLNKYSSPDLCSKIIYSTDVVTSKLRPIGLSSWYYSTSNLGSYDIRLYSGGETDCYISTYEGNLVKGETIDYLTITYRSGSGYDDKRTIWYSLKNKWIL